MFHDRSIDFQREFGCRRGLDLSATAARDGQSAMGGAAGSIARSIAILTHLAGSDPAIMLEIAHDRLITAK